jgi:TonB family protein
MKGIIAMLVLLPAILVGQGTKKVTNKLRDSDGKEIYYVLKSDKAVKHGSYQKFDFKNTLRVSGYYKMGKKDSIWEYFGFKGKLEVEYNYSSKTLLYYQSVINRYKVIDGKDTTEQKLDRPPVHIGEDIYEFIGDSVRYPQDAKEKGVTGKVEVVFTVGKDGKARDFKVLKGPGHGLNEEALRVVKMLSDDWVPGLMNGKEVDTLYGLPIMFELR